MATIPRAEDQPTMTIWPETGHAIGLSRSASYDAAKSGDIPTIRIGKRILVPTAALRRLLKLDEQMDICAPQTTEPVRNRLKVPT